MSFAKLPKNSKKTSEEHSDTCAFSWVIAKYIRTSLGVFYYYALVNLDI